MNDEVKKSTKITIGCMSWTGIVLSIALIAIRAFAPGAQPIENWSIGSWCLMLLPIALPAIVWIVLGIACLLWAFIAIVASTFSKS